MWCSISNFFSITNCNSDKESVEELLCGVDMDRADDRRPDMDLQDTYDTRQSKQRASVKWLLSKAFNNRVPENLREPFYRDHENQEHLKPQIAGSLANAELYCLALGNIYSDPNYHNLNHWSILQTLARKGIYVNEPTDAQLTETVLIQTNPLRMSAHMSVIESMMVLYAKEVVTGDRVLAAIQRFNFSTSSPEPVTPQDHEQGLLLWVSHACSALKKRIEQEIEQNAGAEGDRPNAPHLPPIKDLKDLCDGVGLAALISFYCPDELPWSQLLVSYLPTVSESLHNLMLVYNFCERSLPFSVFHMMPEDVTYMRGSMKQNLTVFLADMFNVLEIHPVKCVRYPGMDRHTPDAYPARNSQGVVHKRNLLQSVVTPIPDLRSGLDDPAQAGAFTVTRSPPVHMTVKKTQSLQQSVSEFSEDSLRRGSEDSFVVHRGRGVPTLSSVLQSEEPLLPARLRPAKEKSNNDTKAEERGNGKQAAGRPSNWEDTRKPSYAGRRSRRNSTSDDSQLTIENFGGSQEHLNFIGRNPDKEVAVHVGRKTSAPSGPIENNVAVRSTIQDARGTLQIGYDSDSEKTDWPVHSRKISAPPGLPVENLPVRSTIQDARGTLQIGYDSDSEKPERPVHSRKISAAPPALPIENLPVRSSIQDARGTLQLGYDSDSEKQDREKDSFKLTRQMSSDAISLKNILHSKGSSDLINDIVDGDVSNKMASFADLTKQKMIGEQKGIQIVYMQHEKEDNVMPSKSSFLNKNNGEKKTTTFATLPNTTTWQQQSSNIQQQMDNNHSDDNSPGHNLMSSQLNDIRMKLEEKRRHIENEKRKMEIIMSKQRQKVGKAAFLQAVTKGKGNLVKTPTDSESSSATGSEPRSPGSEASNKPQRPFTLQEITEDAMSVEQKWLDQDGGAPFVETRKTPDIESMDLEQYQQSIAQMNSSLHDIQADIQRLASQQNQIQANQQHALLAEQQHKQHIQAFAAQHHNMHVMQQQQQPPASHYPTQSLYNPMQSYSSAPHLPQYSQMSSSPRVAVEQPQFYLHDQPQPPPRRTWAQQAPPPPDTSYHQQQPELRTWGNKPQQSTGFVLHDTPDMRYQNGGEHSFCNNHVSYTLSQQHASHQNASSLFPGPPATPPTASPQHRNVSVHRQISQLMNDSESSKRNPINLQQLAEAPYEKTRSSSVTHAPIPTPPVDDMEPQNISFIGNADDSVTQGISKLNISSGTRTYRIPSPTRPTISRNSFQQQQQQQQQQLPTASEIEPLPEVSGLDASDPSNEKGFYISFDNEQPKRPKPPLRVKRSSPKKERSTPSSYTDNNIEEYVMQSHADAVRQESARERHKQLERELEEEKRRQEEREAERYRQEKLDREREKRDIRETSQERENAAAAIIIGNDLAHPDPNSVDEMERKKERIMLLSLQRRQQQEELKERKETEAQARREREKAKEEDRQRKKEEQAARRAAILEQHKLKKAIEEAEREGKVLDKSELMGTLKSAPKMRSKTTLTRPRPKTIHVDSGSVEMAEGMLQPSSGKKGSSTNLTANSHFNTPSSTMRRDYYRGSQDSLADRGMGSGILYRDSPDDSRGMSPCRSTNPSLGRRSSYKTSRDVQEPGQIRGRPKYPTYQNFKGRKSNSLMNLCGSSSDQDSMAYRYGDTDSGLGRATPPRRAPSPGMGPMRHLPSPSGPGSLPPGLMTKRRIFDDGSSDISSTPSSMMDYTGPRLYKQPATKSNRGIMLNAVEYCVFPGVVNKEAKQRVLEEIARSESKHFLILFRDAGCQFRALYSYCPDREEVLKLYGTGPKQVNDRMFDRFFKYNSGGKCFSQVHTKHLTVTIDAFTIHNSLWQGKKVNLPNKKDMALVI